jgi:hypothetical protein
MSDDDEVGADTGRDEKVTCPHCHGTGRNHEPLLVLPNGCVFCGGLGFCSKAMESEYRSSEAPTSPGRPVPPPTEPAPPSEGEVEK